MFRDTVRQQVVQQYGGGGVSVNVIYGYHGYANALLCVYAPALKPGRVNHVTFSPGHPGLTWFTNYPGLTRMDHARRNHLFDNVETYKR